MISKSVRPSSNGNKSVQGSDFVLLGKPKLQANVVLFADSKQGKTTFCTDYCPDPIAFINFDRRAHHAVKKAMDRGRKIYFLDVDTPANVTKLNDSEIKKLGQTAVNKVIKNFDWAVAQSREGKVRTIVLDTGTEYSEILNLAITGKAEGVKNDFGRSRDMASREWWRLFNLAREGKAHLIVLARAQEIWQGNEPTGKFKPRGPNVLRDACDWEGQVRLKVRRSKGEVKKTFELEMTKAGINIDEMGATYTEDDWGDEGPFVHACWMQFLETSDIEDWK